MGLTAKTPEMKEFLKLLNAEEFPLVSKKEFNNFVEVHDKSHTCKVGNGKKVEMPLNGAISLISDRVETINGKVENLSWFTKPKIIIAAVLFIVTQIIAFASWKGVVETGFKYLERSITDIKEDIHTNQDDIKELYQK